MGTVMPSTDIKESLCPNTFKHRSRQESQMSAMEQRKEPLYMME